MAHMLITCGNLLPKCEIEGFQFVVDMGQPFPLPSKTFTRSLEVKVRIVANTGGTSLNWGWSDLRLHVMSFWKILGCKSCPQQHSHTSDPPKSCASFGLGWQVPLWAPLSAWPLPSLCRQDVSGPPWLSAQPSWEWMASQAGRFESRCSDHILPTVHKIIKKSKCKRHILLIFQASLWFPTTMIQQTWAEEPCPWCSFDILSGTLGFSDLGKKYCRIPKPRATNW